MIEVKYLDQKFQNYFSCELLMIMKMKEHHYYIFLN